MCIGLKKKKVKINNKYIDLVITRLPINMTSSHRQTVLRVILEILMPLDVKFHNFYFYLVSECWPGRLVFIWFLFALSKLGGRVQ